MYRIHFNESKTIDENITPEDIDIDFFEVKQTLCPDFWDNDEFDINARRNLLVIARDFIEALDIKEYVYDIVLTGSLANYNWDEDNSDIDLHVVVDFSEISDDIRLLKKFFDSERKNWNNLHSDITIYGYPVEIYVQDKKEKHKSSGVYSLLDDKWIKKPSKEYLDDNDTDFDNIQDVTSDYMNKIDDLVAEFEYGDNPESIYNKAGNLFDDIKEMRKAGLDTRNPEMSDGNLIFKSLRRSGYIEKLLDIRTKAYDLLNSL